MNVQPSHMTALLMHNASMKKADFLANASTDFQDPEKFAKVCFECHKNCVHISTLLKNILFNINQL